MSRTWRKGESDYNHSQDYKNRRNKRKEKANSHYSDEVSSPRDNNNRNPNRYYELDTDLD